MKNQFLISLITAQLLLTNTVFAEEDLFDVDLSDILSMESEVKAELGSRSGGQDVTKALSPVDVITSEQIDGSGLTSLTDVLRYFVAGFNAPETSVADGSDHVRAFTLRGMSPDQILVLINGKRVHTSSLMNVNGTIGRGSSNVDLDTITLRSIEKVEILRDGAAAQYGSDAIAGVINIILKGYGHDNSVSAHVGSRLEGDGKQLQVDSFLTHALDYDGFINLSLEAKGQESTQRSGLDRRTTPSSIHTKVGLPESKSFLSALSVEIPQENGLNIYLNGTFSYKESLSSAFFRAPNSDLSIYPQVAVDKYPDGFLPLLGLKNLDTSGALGVKGEFGDGYIWDLSNVVGFNNISYGISESINYDFNSEQSSFDNGSSQFLQNTTNFDLLKIIDDFKLAGGLEYRYENYQLRAGEESSYDTAGSQGLSGFRPSNETDSSRGSFALYFDGTYDITSNFIAEFASRYENYSDFGGTTNFKLALAYNPIEEVLLRSSASTGFRAPSLAQSNYSQISSFVDDVGLLTHQGTFKPNHEVSQSLGAQDLDVEQSQHFTLGGLYKATRNSIISVDFYYALVEDRIMLSDELDINTALQAKYGIDKARFFTNAVDTQTSGVDIKMNHLQEFENSSSLDMGFWFNYNENIVKSFNDDNINRTNSYEQIDRLENGQPKTSLKLLSNYKIEDIVWGVNLSRFGEYQQVRDDVAYDFAARWTVDTDLSYQFSSSTKISCGGINIFNNLPNEWDGLEGVAYGSNGIKTYSRYSPFGYSGAYYYAKVGVTF